MKLENESKKGWIFLIFTLGITWILFWGPLVVTGTPGASFSGPPGPAWAVALFILGGFIPSLLAIVLCWKENSLPSIWKRLDPRNMSIKWWGIILVMVGLGTTGQLLILKVLGFEFDPREFLSRLPLLLPLLILGPISEEVGWRGYALPRLLGKYNFLSASLIIGLAWSLWHLPLFFITGTFHFIYGLSFPAFALGTTAISILYTWFFHNTGGSVWSAVLFHWFYTFAMDTLGGAVTPPPLIWQWLQYTPYILMAILVLVISGPSLNSNHIKHKG